MATTPFVSANCLYRSVRVLRVFDGLLNLANVAVTFAAHYPTINYDDGVVFPAWLLFSNITNSLAPATVSFGHNAAGNDWATGLTVGGPSNAEDAFPILATSVLPAVGAVPAVSVTGAGSGTCIVSVLGWTY